MKRYFLFLLMGISLNALAQYRAERSYNADFGVIDEGTVDTVLFRIYNPEAKPLKLGKLRAGCGCISIRVINKVILPDKEGLVEVLYNSSGNRGNITRYAKIALAPGDSITLNLTGYVKARDLKNFPPDTTTKNPVRFYKTTHDFGTVKADTVVSFRFKFVNTGNKPVNIDNAQSSCGCVVPSYTKEPVLPGQTGEIEVRFNSSGKYGRFEKTVYAQFSIGTSVLLTIRGVVPDSE